jgi:3-methyladenine DNA glycosylase AlkD
MDKEKLIDNYRIFLIENSDSDRAIQEKRYLYSDLKHYGVSVWKRREYFRKHQKDLSELTKKEAVNLALKAWKDDYFEVRALALSLLEINSHKLDKSDMPIIEKLMRDSKGWAFLDSLIIPLIPSILEKDKSVYEYLQKWIKDKDFWVRRSALLAQLLLFRKGKGDKKIFFEMAESQFDEIWIDKVYSDKLIRTRARFFIRKAIGWMLREMSAKDPESVTKFLKKNKNKMSGLSYREGSRKLSGNYLNLLN